MKYPNVIYTYPSYCSEIDDYVTLHIECNQYPAAGTSKIFLIPNSFKCELDSSNDFHNCSKASGCPVYRRAEKIIYDNQSQG
ncbi:MAG: hypothetical protein HPY74_06045 [Firmicutes bacterium]|nr:hypothetical protein [Bacillota bacterium]